MRRSVEARIDLEALGHNLRIIKGYAPNSNVMAVIKANGYGHGMLRVARALNGVDAYAVACVDEALQLRHVGITLPIVLLGGFFSNDELALCAKHDLSVVVHQQRQIDQLAAADLVKPLTVWLKIDTGMHRLGVEPELFKTCYERLISCSTVATVHLMTHFACADELDISATTRQIECFDRVLNGLDVQQSMANSAAIIKFPTSHRNWVRPGVSLYGISPFADQSGLDLNLRPVMTLTSQIMSIRQCKAGDALGYGAAWVCPEDMPVGIVAIGYGDGYPRHAANGTPVLVNGVKVPLVGRVSMDSIFVDLRACPNVNIGDEVILWGQGLPVEEVAVASSTIPYELVCKVTNRVQFVY